MYINFICFRNFNVFTVFISVLYLSACGGDKDKGMSDKAGKQRLIIFGIYATDSPKKVVEYFSHTLGEIEDKLNENSSEAVKIELKIFPDYDDCVRALAANEADFSRLGPASYVKLRRLNPSVRLLAMESNKGKRFFEGYIIVHKDSVLQDMQDLRGKSFAFGNRDSTIGTYLAVKELLEAGISIDDLASYDFLDRHDNVVLAVHSKKYDAGAAKDKTVKSMMQEGKEVRVLKSFKNVTKPWISTGKLDDQLAQSIKEILLAKTYAKMRKVDKAKAKGSKILAFMPAKDSYYDVIEQAMQDSSEFLTKLPNDGLKY